MIPPVNMLLSNFLFLGGRLNRTVSQPFVLFLVQKFRCYVASSVFQYILTRGLSPERSRNLTFELDLE